MSTRRVSAPTVVLAVAVIGAFMAFVDATIVNIAVPSIARHFGGARLSSVSWVLNAYNIVFAAFLVGGGQLADLLGRRRVFALGIILFTTASALCAVATSLGQLVAFRAIQAAGSAMLVPSSLAIVLEAHDESRRTHAVALWSAVAALAAGIGPPLGGLLITASSWRLVFLVNIPVGLLSLVLARRLLVESRSPGRRRVPDLLGGSVLALAIAALVLAVTKGSEWGWADARVLGSFAAALLLGAWFLVRSARHRTPVLDLSLLRIRAFDLSNSVIIIAAAGFYAYTLCNVLFLTSVWRYSILDAGLALTPGPIVAILLAGAGSRLAERFSYRAVAVPGALIWAAGMVYFATRLQITPDFLGRWLPGIVILGIGAGLCLPTLAAASVRSVPGTRFAIASSLASVARQIGASLGVAALIAILGHPTPLQALHAFRHGWLFAAGCFLAAAITSLGLILRTDAGAEPTLPSGAGRLARAGVNPMPTPAEVPSLADSAGQHADAQPQSVADFLRNVPVFAPLSDEMRAELADLAHSVRLSRGEWLFHEGDPADGVYVVRLGHLEVLTEAPAQERLNTLTRGAVLGELALLSESTRSGSVRALRDSELLRIDRDSFTALLHSEPELALGLTRVLSAQLQASRAIPVSRRPRPVTIALCALHDGVPLLDLADQLSREMCRWGRVAVLYPEDPRGRGQGHDAGDDARGDGGDDAVARYGPLIERCEADHDHVLMVCGKALPISAGWDGFCLSRADRVLAVADLSSGGGGAGDRGGGGADGGGGSGSDVTETIDSRTREALAGCDLVALGVRVGTGELSGLVDQLGPSAIFAISAEAKVEDVARTARRLSGRSIGVVLSGGGARAFAHLGALDVLLDAGVVFDRVGGVSMGAFIGGQLACGRDAGEIDACCYEEWVRRNPINDYTLPRHALIKGHKGEAMLERVFGDAHVEELSRTFYCASVDLQASRLVIDRTGPLIEAVGASISLPLIAPPLRRGEELLIDGSLLDNLPVEPMSSTGEGPVLAIDIKAGHGRPRADVREEGLAEPNRPDPSLRSVERPHRKRLPSLPETMGRIALLSSANTAEAARRFADMTITVRVPTVGLTEFHQIDQARETGREIARAALEDAPGWLLGDDDDASPSTAGRRTVLRV